MHLSVDMNIRQYLHCFGRITLTLVEIGKTKFLFIQPVSFLFLTSLSLFAVKKWTSVVARIVNNTLDVVTRRWSY